MSKDAIAQAKRQASIKKGKQVTGFVIRLILGIVFISPLLVGFIFSFQPEANISILPPLGTLFKDATLWNYQRILDRTLPGSIDIVRFSLNSLIVCAIVICAQLLVASLTAYSLTFFQYKGKGFFFSIILIAMMIPGQVTTLSNFLMVQKLKLLNTHIGLALPYLICGAAVFMMRQYYMTIPKDLKGAADIDGCSDMGFLFRIILPNSVPTLISLGIYLFVDTYNQYFWPLLVVQRQEMFTVQIGMNMLIDSETTAYTKILAGAILALLLPMVTFIIGQDYMIKGMADGAIKE